MKLWLAALVVVIGSAEVAAAAPFDEQNLPPACYVVFPTVDEAANQCPFGAYLIKVKDFWSGKINGYSCYCGKPKFESQETIPAVR